MAVSFQCSGCGQKYEATDRLASKGIGCRTITCRRCGKMIEVPMPDGAKREHSQSTPPPVPPPLPPAGAWPASSPAASTAGLSDAKPDSDKGHGRRILGFRPIAWVAATMAGVLAFAKASPAVATITIEDERGRPLGLGSGFFVPDALVRDRYDYHDYLDPEMASYASSRGYLLQACYLMTNNHVIRAGAHATVTLSNGRKGLIESVVAEDENRDLALLCVMVCSSKPVATLSLSDEKAPPVGRTVYAIGNPTGLSNSLSKGLISGQREIVPGVSWLQTTAPISAGSSGGPLLAADGSVLGVTTASRVGGQNLNFAVPVSEIRAFLKLPFHSRELWRGRSFLLEEDHALSPFRCATPANAVAESKSVRRFRAGLASYDAHRYEDALSDLEVAAGTVPEDMQYLVYFLLGRAHGAILPPPLTNDLSQPVDEQDVRARRSNPHFHRAVDAYEKAIALNERFASSFNWLSVVYFWAKQFPEALVAADRLVKLLPRCSAAYHSRAASHLFLNRVQKAVSDCQTAIELDPNDPRPYALMAACLDNVGQYDEAVASYEAAIERSAGAPTEAGGWCEGLGFVYYHAGRFEKAIGAYEKAKSLGVSSKACDLFIADCKAQLQLGRQHRLVKIRGVHFAGDFDTT